MLNAARQIPPFPPRLAIVIGFCVGLLVGGFATAYLAINYFPYAVFMRAIEVGAVIVPEDLVGAVLVPKDHTRPH